MDAKHQLKNFISQFPSLKEDEVNELVNLIPVIAPAKGTILVKEGGTQNECYYVLKGLVRQYQYVEGNERTTEFYNENNGTISSIHYTNQTPSSFYLECLEDCLLITGNIEIDEANYKKFPALVEITKQMIEHDLNSIKANHTQFVLSSPKERYLNFLKNRPTLINRVPLNQIASYLGLTPESLSRIRKRIVSNKQ